MTMEDCDYEASKTLISICTQHKGSVKPKNVFAIEESNHKGYLGTSAFDVPAYNKLQRPHSLITLAGNTDDANPLGIKNRPKRRRNDPVTSLKVKKQKLETEVRKLAKEMFAANMEHEKSVLSENYKSKESQMLHDFEVKKQELEAELRNKEMKLENRMREREKTFVEERDRELANLVYLRDVASRELENLKLERAQLAKKKNDVVANQKNLESQQLDMKRDIDDLAGSRMKLKDEREQFIKERERFVAFVEKLKGCTGCGEIVSEFVKREEALENEKDSALKSKALDEEKNLAEIQNADGFLLPKLADGNLKEAVQVTSENNKPNVGTSMGNPLSFVCVVSTCDKVEAHPPITRAGNTNDANPLSMTNNSERRRNDLTTSLALREARNNKKASKASKPKTSPSSTLPIKRPGRPRKYPYQSTLPLSTPQLKKIGRPKRESYQSGYLTCVLKET